MQSLVKVEVSREQVGKLKNTLRHNLGLIDQFDPCRYKIDSGFNVLFNIVKYDCNQIHRDYAGLDFVSSCAGDYPEVYLSRKGLILDELVTMTEASTTLYLTPQHAEVFNMVCGEQS